MHTLSQSNLLRRTLWLLAVTLALSTAACGQVITKPTAQPATATPTLEPSPSITTQPTNTPAPYTPEPTATPTIEPTPVVHAIQSGETLIAVASKYGVSVQAIQEANGIVDPRLLRIGQQLFIPTDAESLLGAGTPTPAPTPLPLTASSLYFGKDAAGDLWALGEIENPGTEPLEGVEVRVMLLDEAGGTLAVGESLIVDDLLEAGERAPFGVHFVDPPADFANYFVETLTAYPAHLGFYYRDLEIVDIEESGERYYTYRLSGVVRNTGPEEAVEVYVIATLYDALDQVVGFRRVEPEHNVIPAGGETTFTLEIIPVGGPVAAVNVVAGGHRTITPAPAP